MPPETILRERVEDAAEAVGAVWPLHSFVTANPLAGYEDRPFHEAVETAAETLGGDGYPSVDTFRRALETDRIDSDVLSARLVDHGYAPDPEASLDRLAEARSDAEPRGVAGESDGSAVASSDPSPMDRVDAVASKWLAAFLEQGTAAWSMPNRDRGFYEAFRAVARYDADVPDGDAIAALPADPADAIRALLADHPPDRWAAGFERHLASLPGWTGLIKRRAADGGDWQSAYPITLTGYLAARLALAAQFGAPLVPDDPPATAGADTESTTSDDAPDIDPDAIADDADSSVESDVPLAEVWLRAWEATYRESLVDALSDASASLDASATDVEASDEGRPAAQLVFCIDTRSEIIRRHIESTGAYETHGYAGFFGVPMRYDGHDSAVTVDACPPIVDACHHVAERPVAAADAEPTAHDRWHDAVEAAESIVESLESNAAAAFSYVESTGVGYGVALAARTLLPARVYDLASAVDERVPDVHAFCTPTFDAESDVVADGGSDALPAGLTLEERVEYAAAAFELMGWDDFARLVVFAGHASHTTNNPFGSSLDCGACAGNPGGPSARVLAAICNDDAVRARLHDRGIDVPADTVFVAGEHDTTTDTVELYADDVPETHADDLAALRADLETARAGATAERAADLGVETDAGVRETERRAADWAETRPEWGLAGNAAFVVGPRGLTDDLDLDGRSFLHSYDWRADPDGDALEAIVSGPMVVTQWINAQYYFATVDNAVFGSGSKVTQNPVGNVGVYQGNGGDLMGGLPLQSLEATDGEPYHQPIRLSAVVHAPVDRVEAACASVETVRTLLDNGWLSLTVVDPTREHRAFRYAGTGEWVAVDDPSTAEPTPPVEPATAGE